MKKKPLKVIKVTMQEVYDAMKPSVLGSGDMLMKSIFSRKMTTQETMGNKVLKQLTTFARSAIRTFLGLGQVLMLS